MVATYHLQSIEELTDEVVDAIRKSFRRRPITITVAEEVEEDETIRLLNNPAQLAFLRQSIAEFQQGNVVTLNPHTL